MGLGSENLTLRINLAKHLLEMVNDLPQDWKHDSKRQFRLLKHRKTNIPKQKICDIKNRNFEFYYSFFEYIDLSVFNCPLFTAYDTKKSLTNLLNSIIDGNDEFDFVRNFRSSTRDIERSCKLMSETKNMAKTAESRALLAQTIDHERSNNPKPGCSKNFK